MYELLGMIILGAIFYYVFVKWPKQAKEERKIKDAKYEYLGEDGKSLVDRERFFSEYESYLQKYEEKFDKQKVEGTYRILDESEKSHCHEKLKIVNIIMPKKAGEWGVFETNTRDFKIYWKGGKSELSSIILVSKSGEISVQFVLSVLMSSEILMTEDFYLKLSDYQIERQKEHLDNLGELNENYKNVLANYEETGDSTALRNFLSKAIPSIKDLIRRRDIPGKFQYANAIYFVKTGLEQYSIGIVPESLADTYEEPEELKTQFKNSRWEKFLEVLENQEHNLNKIDENLEKIKIHSDLLNEEQEYITKLENEIKRRESVENSKKEN